MAIALCDLCALCGAKREQASVHLSPFHRRAHKDVGGRQLKLHLLMRSLRPTAIAGLTLLLLLAACAPAEPVAFAPATQAPPPAATAAPEPNLVATETLAPSPTATETPAPTATATETLAPTATPTAAPTNTPTPEPTAQPPTVETPVAEVQAPQIAGLRFDAASGQYFAEAGNRYGLKEGEYAGEYYPNSVARPKIKDKLVEVKGGVVLTWQILESLYQQANTPERLKKGTWLIALPLDPRTSEETMVEVDNLNLSIIRSLIINGVKADMKVVNSFGTNTEFERGNFGGGIPSKPINIFPKLPSGLHFNLHLPPDTPDETIFLNPTPYKKESKNLGAIIATSANGILKTKPISGKNCNIAVEVIDESTRIPWTGRFGLDKNVLVLNEKGQPRSLAECLASSSSCSLVFVAARE